MKFPLFILLPFIVLMLGFASCEESPESKSWKINLNELNEILDRKASGMEMLAMFNKHFNVRHHMLLSGSHPKAAIWSAKALIYDRYVFVMRIPVEASAGGRLIQGGGDVEMYIFEIEKVEGRSIIYSGNQRRVSLTEWKKLLDSGMDFSTIGYPMKVDKPVCGLRDVFPAA